MHGLEGFSSNYSLSDTYPKELKTRSYIQTQTKSTYSSHRGPTWVPSTSGAHDHCTFSSRGSDISDLFGNPHLNTHMRIHTCTSTHIQAYTRTHIHLDTHAYANTRTYTHHPYTYFKRKYILKTNNSGGRGGTHVYYQRFPD